MRWCCYYDGCAEWDYTYGRSRSMVGEAFLRLWDRLIKFSRYPAVDYSLAFC